MSLFSGSTTALRRQNNTTPLTCSLQFMTQKRVRPVTKIMEDRVANMWRNSIAFCGSDRSKGATTYYNHTEIQEYNSRRKCAKEIGNEMMCFMLLLLLFIEYFGASKVGKLVAYNASSPIMHTHLLRGHHFLAPNHPAQNIPKKAIC